MLERLVAEEGVPQTDIVILSSHALAKSDFAGGRLGPYTLTEDPAKRKGILFSSIRAFKGLESPVVILTRARGPRRRDPRAAALRRAVPRAQPLRDRGAASCAAVVTANSAPSVACTPPVRLAA